MHLYTYTNSEKDNFTEHFKRLIVKEFNGIHQTPLAEEGPCDVEFLHKVILPNSAGTIVIDRSYQNKYDETEETNLTYYGYNVDGHDGEYSDELHLILLGIKLNHVFEGITVGTEKRDSNSITIKYGFLYNDVASALSTTYPSTYNPRYRTNDTVAVPPVYNQYNPHIVTHLGSLDREFMLTDMEDPINGSIYNLLTFLGLQSTNGKVDNDFKATRSLFMERIQELIDRDMFTNNIIFKTSVGETHLEFDSTV